MAKKGSTRQTKKTASKTTDTLRRMAKDGKIPSDGGKGTKSPKKKGSPRQQSLADDSGELVEKPPKKLQDLAEQYAADLKASNKATKKRNTSKDNLIAGMAKANYHRMLVDLPGGGQKIVVLEDTHNVKFEKPKEIDDPKKK